MEIDFDKYTDPFKALNIHMAIICDLEQGGKIDEGQAFEQIKSLYKQFKFYYKHTLKPKLENMDKEGFYR